MGNGWAWFGRIFPANGEHALRIHSREQFITYHYIDILTVMNGLTSRLTLAIPCVPAD